MNNKVVAAVIGLVAVGMIAAIIIFALRESAPDESASNSTSTMSQQEMGDTPSGSSNSSGDEANSSTVRTGEVSMNIEDFAYSLENITVKKGTTVTWTNQDEASHDVSPDEEKAGAPESELLGQGESYSYTFDTVGEFGYHCSPHPYMEAKITVVE